MHKYSKPEIEIILLEEDDVIKTSGLGPNETPPIPDTEN